ncbi:MAG: sensor histidine kinase [Candidatus Hydrogenedentes bacterium]|nr:sensor histidine kinase [Candidatus Hydrogenedentota bacterium]
MKSSYLRALAMSALVALAAFAMDRALCARANAAIDGRWRALYEEWLAENNAQFEVLADQLLALAEARRQADPSQSCEALLNQDDAASPEIHVVAFDVRGHAQGRQELPQALGGLLSRERIQALFKDTVLKDESRFLLRGTPADDGASPLNAIALVKVYPDRDCLIAVARQDAGAAARMAAVRADEVELAQRIAYFIHLAAAVPLLLGLIALPLLWKKILARADARNPAHGLPPITAAPARTAIKTVTLQGDQLELIALRGERDRLLQEAAADRAAALEEARHSIAESCEQQLRATYHALFDRLTGVAPARQPVLPLPRTLLGFDHPLHPGLALHAAAQQGLLPLRESSRYAAGDHLAELIAAWPASPPIRLTVTQEPCYTALGRTVLDFCVHELASNALAASESGLPLEIAIKAPRGQHAGEIILRDYGNGMPPAQRQRAATPFFSTRPEHPGLGIALCRLLLERAGGSLTLYSQPDQGCAAIIGLPGGETPADSPAAEAPS